MTLDFENLINKKLFYVSGSLSLSNTTADDFGGTTTEEVEFDEMATGIPVWEAAKAGPKKAPAKPVDDDDDDDEDEDVVDDWEKGDDEEEENWDPDFDEFDVPASKGKKAGSGGKKKNEEEDDFKFDDDMKEFDLFNDSDKDEDDDDDDF